MYNVVVKKVHVRYLISCFLFSLGNKTLPRYHSLCVQYMVTSVLQDQQYMFGVRSLLVDKKALLMKKTWPCVVSTTDAIAAVASHTRTSLAMQNTYFFDKHRLSLHTTVLVQRHHDCPGRLSAVTCKQTGLRAPPPAMQSHDLIQAPSNPHMTATIGL